VIITVSNMMIDENYAAMNIDASVGPHVLIEVQDTGIGMPPAVLEKIFDPFFTTKEIGKGTGLGLSTSIAIVKSHGGFLRVYSEVGRGSDFKLHLPAVPSASDAAAIEAKPALRRGRGELVLLVDDETPIRSVAQQTLEAFGYRVVAAADGAEAVAIYAGRQKDIAVVLTDMQMPIMDGHATCEVLVRLNPEVRIIAASGMSVSNCGERSCCPNVKQFLIKPYTAEEMLAALAEALTA
jgi:CheY-like chemotaxis protein